MKQLSEQSEVRLIAPIAIALGITAYVWLAEHFELYIVGIPLPGVDELRTRIFECSLLWTFTWLAIGLVMVIQRRLCFEKGYSWFVAIVPFLLGMVWFGIEFYRIWMKPRAAEWVDVAIIVMPLFQCALMTGMLLSLHSLWRIATRDRMHEKNECRKCGYSLIGNESGTCPECGTPIP